MLSAAKDAVTRSFLGDMPVPCSVLPEARQLHAGKPEELAISVSKFPHEQQ